jgi:hypothetical protein
MKRTALMLVASLLCSALMCFAGNKNKKYPAEVTGRVCNAKLRRPLKDREQGDLKPELI